MANKVFWNNDVGDILTAIDTAMSDLDDALDELKGLGELLDVYHALQDSMSELEKLKDQYESYMSGEYQQQLADMAREYYRSVI